MTLFYSHRDRLHDISGISLLGTLVRRAIGRAGAAFASLHRAIVTAKTRRVQRELMFHDSGWDGQPLELDPREGNGPAGDAAKFPRQPLILGDKWDF